VGQNQSKNINIETKPWRGICVLLKVDFEYLGEKEKMNQVS
jgi:hypothetical protein